MRRFTTWAVAAVALVALAAILASGCRPTEESQAMTDSAANPDHPPARTGRATPAPARRVSAPAAPIPARTGRATQPNTESKNAPDATPARTETATFAAGCFWGVEAAFRAVPGVVDTQVGYTGGHTENPTYKDVCSDTTGHAEAVQVAFDPAKVAYEALLDVFWNTHNPTTPNRQGPDVGSQYRSAIFTHGPEQEAAAKASKERLAACGKWGEKPIVTEIVPAAAFWPAEEYHQRYLEKRGQATCHTP